MKRLFKSLLKGSHSSNSKSKTAVQEQRADDSDHNGYYGNSQSSPTRNVSSPPPPSSSSRPPQTFSMVNETGHRVTQTTVRVPPPPPLPQAPPNSMPGAHCVAVPPAAPDPLQIANEATRVLVKKFIADIWNRGEIDLIPEVCSPNLRFNGNTGFDRIGHDGLARMVATIREALDEYHCEIHSMVVEHNKAFCRLRFTGKHTGALLGYEPTHKVVAWMGATEFTVQNGKILKVWELGDVKSLEEQLQAEKPVLVEEDEI